MTHPTIPGQHLYQEATHKLLQLLNRIKHPPIQSLTHTPSHLSILKSIIKCYPLLIAETEPALLHGTYSDMKFVEKLWIAIERNSDYFFPLRAKEFLQGEKFVLKRIEIFTHLERILKSAQKKLSKDRLVGIKKKNARDGAIASRPSKLKDHFENHHDDPYYQLSQSINRNLTEELTERSRRQQKIDAQTNSNTQKVGAQRPETLDRTSIDSSCTKSKDAIFKVDTDYNKDLDKALEDLDRYTKRIKDLEKDMERKMGQVERRITSVDKLLSADHKKRQEEDFESMMFGEEQNEDFYKKFDTMVQNDQDRLKSLKRPTSQSKVHFEERSHVSTPPLRRKKLSKSLQDITNSPILIDDDEVNTLISTVRKNLAETNAFITYCHEKSLRFPKQKIEL